MPHVDAPLMLSVSGSRGLFGRSMTPAVAADFASAFGSIIRSQSTRSAPPLLCVGRDSRPSGASLMNAAIAGLAATGCNVVNLGVVATPTVAVMIAKHKAAGGMAITASHNPIEWNGLKCLNSDGVAPPPEHANEIIRRFKAREFCFAAPDFAATMTTDETADAAHVARVLNIVDVKAIRRANIKVVLDSINGAGCNSGKMLLEKLGCQIVHINGEPNGLFAHKPEPTETNLASTAKIIARTKAAVGFAQDPDADRLAIIDGGGRYIGEEYTLILAAKCVFDERAAKREKKPVMVAANLSTSRMIDDLAARYENITVLRTAVGEANVVAAMKPRKSKALIGGEGNGGVIVPPTARGGVCWVRDSLSAMALTLHLMAKQKRSLSDIVADLPRYAMIKHKFDLAAIGGVNAVKPALERVTKHFANARISTVDGVRLDFTDGWVHLRPSNTEPIVRLIAEATSDSRAWELIDEVAVAAKLK